MRLYVTIGLPGEEEEPIEQEVEGFADIDKIGQRVATAARRWLRSVSVRKGTQSASVSLRATFEEHHEQEVRPRKRSRKKVKAQDDAANA